MHTYSYMPRRSPVTPTQLGGYGLAFLGVCVYNYRKVQAQVKEKDELAAAAAEQKDGHDETMVKLLDSRTEGMKQGRA